jgi:hypothetical protein
MTLSGGVYTETAKTPVRVTGGSSDLPAGTVVATFAHTGAGSYAGPRAWPRDPDLHQNPEQQLYGLTSRSQIVQLSGTH